LERRPHDGDVSGEQGRDEDRVRFRRLDGRLEGREAAVGGNADLRPGESQRLGAEVYARDELHRPHARDDTPSPVATPAAHAHLKEAQRTPARPIFAPRPDSYPA